MGLRRALARPPANVPGVIFQKNMTHAEIVAAYMKAGKSGQSRITRAARRYLKEKGVEVSQQSIEHFRRNGPRRSPLAEHYSRALAAAIKEHAAAD